MELIDFIAYTFEERILQSDKTTSSIDKQLTDLPMCKLVINPRTTRTESSKVEFYSRPFLFRTHVVVVRFIRTRTARIILILLDK